MGIRNVFEDPGVAGFIRAACLDGLEARQPAIELYALEAGGEMLAVVVGISNHERFSAMFNSITASDRARLSPGIILFGHIAANCIARGIEEHRPRRRSCALQGIFLRSARAPVRLLRCGVEARPGPGRGPQGHACRPIRAEDQSGRDVRAPGGPLLDQRPHALRCDAPQTARPPGSGHPRPGRRTRLAAMPPRARTPPRPRPGPSP